MATKKYLDYAGLKRVLAKLLPGARKIWHGTQAEWDALSAAERDKYDQAEIIDSTAEIYHIKPDWAGAVAVTTAQIDAGYTAPSDGLFCITFDSASGVVSLLVNNVVVASAYSNGGDYRRACAQVPVSQGDVIKLQGSTEGITGNFIPWAN